MSEEMNIHTLTEAAENALPCLDEDPNRRGLEGTPERWARMMLDLTTPPEFKFTTFRNEGYDAMVVLRAIPFHSLCEHHMVPFVGEATVGYIPDRRIAGLSKLARTVDYFARRLQVQERMTDHIARFLHRKLRPKGVGVVIRARHLCMEMRGVRKAGAETITSCLLGAMRNARVRSEFFAL